MHHEPANARRRPPLLWGLASLACAGLLAVPLGAGAAGGPERGSVVLATCFLALLVLAVSVRVAIGRRDRRPEDLAVLFMAVAAVSLAGVYLMQTAQIMGVRADILIWAESSFVNDVLKLRIGAPLYSPDPDNEAFIYTPLAQMLTFVVAAPLGLLESVPFFRALQLLQATLASVVAFLCCRLLAGFRDDASPSRLWALLWLPGLFLVATNSLTNPYVRYAHNDGLTLLISITGYYLLLRHARSGNARLLPLLALVPAAGFYAKQSAAIWAPLLTGWVAVFDRPRSARRTLLFGAAAFGGILALVAVSYLAWGADFFYWAFHVPRTVRVVAARSIQHVFDTWVYWAAGFAGGLLVLNRAWSVQRFGLWLVWLGLMLTQAYTSGNAWMVHHMGPGSLLAGVWLFAGLATWWTSAAARPSRAWLEYGMRAAIIVLAFAGLGFVRVPVLPPVDAIEQYVRAIESEFDGELPERVLLDAGSWVYLPSRVVMKDRVTTIGDRGYTQAGDFSDLIGRLRSRYYHKILVRGLHVPDFWYDHQLWAVSSGIREAMVSNYREVRRIPGVPGDERYLLSEISVLVPRAGAAEPDG